MSLATNIQNLATAIGADIKDARGRVGDLASLATTNKASAVAAINELQSSIAGAGATINDGVTNTSSVWSSSRTNTAISSAVAALVNSSPAALDTLKELSDALGGDANFAATVNTALGNRVRVDASQTFTAPQQQQGRANIGAVAAADVGNTETDFVATYSAAKA